MTEQIKRYERETGKEATTRTLITEIVNDTTIVSYALTESFVLWLASQLTWRQASEKPEKDQEVLARYKSRYGRNTVVRAEYFRKQQEEMDCNETDAEYDEETDTYYAPEGWYELVDNWGDYSSVRIVEGEVDSWLPIPPMEKY